MPSRRPTNPAADAPRPSHAVNGTDHAGNQQSFLQRIAWFVAIWAASVAFLSLIAALIRLAL